MTTIQLGPDRLHSTIYTEHDAHSTWGAVDPLQGNLWFLPPDLNALKTMFYEVIIVSGTSPGRVSGLQDP